MSMKALLAILLFCLPALAADLPSPAAAACGQDDVEFDVKTSDRQATVPQPQPGKALVFVVEDFDRPEGELITPTARVGLDGAWVGANRGRAYLFFPVDPGKHHLCSDWQSVPSSVQLQASLASLTAEAGRTYYFRTRILEHSGGVWTLDLERVDDDEGQLLVATSPLSGYRPKK